MTALVTRPAIRSFPAPYYIVVCDRSGCTIFFPTLCHKRHDLKKKKFRRRGITPPPKKKTHTKKLLNLKCVFWFSLQLLSKTFLILRKIQRYIIISVHTYSCTVPVILTYFNETSVFSLDFGGKKYSNIKFHEKPSSRSRVFFFSRHDAAYSRFSQFCKRT